MNFDYLTSTVQTMKMAANLFLLTMAIVVGVAVASKIAGSIMGLGCPA